MDAHPAFPWVIFINYRVFQEMKIEVRLFSYFCDLLGKRENRCSFSMETKDGLTCGDLLTTLNISLELPMVILVNGSVKGKGYMLEEGDVVSILPPVEGG